MKRLGPYIILIAILLVLNSCTTYYYSTIDSNDGWVVKMDNGDFVEENDTVSITYCFYGENLPIEITIYNKLDHPLFLDWQQSAVIVEETDLVNTTYSYRDFLFPEVQYESSGTFTGRVRVPEYVAFIPPKSIMNSTPITLENFEFHRISGSEYVKQPFLMANNKERLLKCINFTEDDTPLRFRSYLTLYTLNEDGSRANSLVYDQQFFISRLIKGGSVSPVNFPASNAQRGDFFYVRKENGTTIAIITGVVAIGVAGVAIDAAASPRRY